MIKEYVKFFINGGILGIIAWGIQLLIYIALSAKTPFNYALAGGVTYLPLICVNFYIQRAWIFKKSGAFTRFVVANLAIMILVSILSSVCMYAVDGLAGTPWGARCGFILAALLGSVPSFLLNRNWVFRGAVEN